MILFPEYSIEKKNGKFVYVFTTVYKGIVACSCKAGLSGSSGAMQGTESVTTIFRPFLLSANQLYLDPFCFSLFHPSFEIPSLSAQFILSLS